VIPAVKLDWLVPHTVDQPLGIRGGDLPEPGHQRISIGRQDPVDIPGCGKSQGG
jgi:hypothetical protein